MLGKLFILGLYLFAWSFPASAELFGRRGVSDSRFKNVRTAILTVNGEPTTCEVGVLNSGIALFAANCLVLGDDGYRNTTFEYGVNVYEGGGSTEPAKYSVIDPILFGSIFDAPTWNANLAIVRFKEQSNDTYIGYATAGPYAVSNSSYTIRPLDFDTGKWRDPVMVQQENDLVDECSSYGRLYRGNKFLLACNNITVESVYDSNCRMPYGALYTMSGDYVTLVAIYTHSVILGPDECQGKRYNYYTYVSPFLQSISWSMYEPVYAIDENGTKTTISASTEPTVDIDPGVVDVRINTTTVGADLYRRYQSRETSKAASESPNDSDTYSDDQWSESESSQTDTSLDSDSDNDGSESSKTTRIIVGVIVGMVLAAVIVGFFVYRWLKVKRNDARWDPRAETINVYSVGNGLNADVNHIRPPAYSPPKEDDNLDEPRTVPNFRVPELEKK